MRLRPSGNQGPVATSWPAFQDYQTSDAWVWEHLALTRAAVIAGPDGLGADVSAFRDQILSRPVSAVDLAGGLEEMRARIAAAKAPAGELDVKTGAGRLQDIELLAQTGALLSGNGARDVAGGLDGLRAKGFLSPDAQAQLEAAAALCWAVLLGGRLLAEKVIRLDELAPDGRALLLGLSGQSGPSALTAALARAETEADGHIRATLARMQDDSL